MKKKFSHFTLLLIFLLFLACSQDDNIKFNDENLDVELLSPDHVPSIEVINKQVQANPEFFKFEDPHSELWIEESNLRSSSPAISVVGFDTKENYYTSVIMFTVQPACGNLQRLVQYISKRYYYKKLISVPKGATVILPPASIMEAYRPMGLVPGTNKCGYTYKFSHSDNTNDYYYLMTEGNEVTHNAYGQQVTPLDAPNYGPCYMNNPHNMTFKYQYQLVEW